MNEPRAELLIRTARAVDADLTADSYVESADNAVDQPEAAARHCWDAAAALSEVSKRFERLADQQRFQARRMEAAQRRENASGHEHRLGPAA